MKHLLVEFTADQAIEFFEEVIALGIADDDIEGKNAVLHDFIQRGKVKRAWTTDRTKEQILIDLKKNYNDILNMTNEDKQ
jgi:hypothetical protein